MPTGREILQVAQAMQRDLAGDLSLAGVAEKAGWSPAHLHRDFRRFARETPKQFALRLRVEHAASLLATGDATVLDVALATGFASHEVFTRAFVRAYGRSPRSHRAIASGPGAAEQATLVGHVGPCIHLYRFSTNDSPEHTMTKPTITREHRDPQPFLFVRRECSHAEIAGAIGECLPRVYGHCQQHALAMAGPPIVRYARVSPGLLTIEGGFPLLSPAPGDGDIEAGELQGGPVATAVHLGPYDALPQTHAAIERWIGEQGHRAKGAPWEQYLTDPGEEPDPAKWRTQVVWPLER
jgi:AraC family transcriptional regulator